MVGRGKELAIGDTVAAARRLFENASVQVVPVLDGGRYVGAINRATVPTGISDRALAEPLVRNLLPTCRAGTLAPVALDALDASGAKRMVVLDGNGEIYVGLVCLRSDRQRLCVDEARDVQPRSPTEGDVMAAVAGDARVADLVLARPSRSRVFERFGIDYCCGGKKQLAVACTERELDLGEVARALDEPGPAEADEIDWRGKPVSELCAHIVDHHHAYLRDELPAMRVLVDKVATAHGRAHSELVDIRATFAAMADEFEQHMAKEEQVLFPACVALERGDGAGFAFGSVESPIGVMLHEHDEVATSLADLRALTHGYVVPDDACASYRSMLDRLHTLETDTHRHVHEENNILFPRAVELEADQR